MDAPPVLGVLEALEALAVEDLSAAQLGRAMRASGKARGRLDVVDACFLAAFVRLGGHRREGATDTSSWLAWAPAATPASRHGPNGLTNMDNLLLLCDRHHHLVHEGGWRLAGTAMDFNVHRPDGTLFEHTTRGPP